MNNGALLCGHDSTQVCEEFFSSFFSITEPGRETEYIFMTIFHIVGSLAKFCDRDKAPRIVYVGREY